MQLKSVKEVKISQRYYQGYTDDKNPWRDENLTQQFFWDKKYEAEGKSRREIQKIRKKQEKWKYRSVKLETNRRKILEIKQKRQAITKKRLEDEEQKIALMRELENQRNQGWEKKEHDYHRKTTIKKAQNRVQNHRPKPIDIIICVIHQVELDQKIVLKRIRSPIEVLENLNSIQIKEFLNQLINIENMMDDHLYAWKNVRSVAEYQRSLIKNINYSKENSLEYIKTDVLLELKGKSLEELDEIEDNCESCLMGDILNKVVDTEYWENVVKYCKLVKAKLMLRGYYTQYLDLIRKKSRLENIKDLSSYGNDNEKIEQFKNRILNEHDDSNIPFFLEENIKFTELLALSISAFEDEIKLNKLRSNILDNMAKLLITDLSISNPAAYELETLPASEIVSQPLNKTNFRISNEIEILMKNDIMIPLGQQRAYLWQDKYRPRKPEYYNKVKTGFSWTKYNQAHYSIENPPPKIVIGYKFNIFYPDLIDKVKTPEFKVFEEEGSPYATIIFKGGPPYEDIAFRIVNQMWEVNTRRGYRCRFQDDVFSLYFNFKRHRYRR